MRNKGIAVIAAALIAASPHMLLSVGATPIQSTATSPWVLEGPEERIELVAGGGAWLLGPKGGVAYTEPAARRRVPLVGAWETSGLVPRPGYRGASEYQLAHAAYRADESTDLLLHFDESSARDEAGRYEVRAGADFSIDVSRALLGLGAASFRGKGSGLSLVPGPGALLGKDSRFGDFSIEFWLYPANAENGESILLWQSLRKVPGGAVSQRLSCSIAAGRMTWTLENFFERPGAATIAAAATRFELRARSPLVPRVWSHHLLRFDGDTGLLEYAIDGVTEAVAYATDSGREGGGASVFSPAMGAASRLSIGEGYAGLLDEFRITRKFVERPTLSPYAREGGRVVSPVVDLGYGNSRIVAIEATVRASSNAGVELAYRVADDWAGWRDEDPAWVPFRPGEPFSKPVRGRYVQLRADLFPDGTGRLGPGLSGLAIRFVPDPPPPPPARVQLVARDGAVEVRWSRVPEADVAGYLIYYGDAPGEYLGTGAAEGPSPVDAGKALSFTLSGLPNGRLVYVAVAAYDAAAQAGQAVSRAGEFSEERSARPSRTAQ